MEQRESGVFWGRREENFPHTGNGEIEITINIPENFVLVEGGTFERKSPDTEKWRSEDETQYMVTVSDFYMSIYEVTQVEYASRAGTTTPFNTENSIIAGKAKCYGHYPYEIEGNYFSQENLETKLGEYRQTIVEGDSFFLNR